MLLSAWITRHKHSTVAKDEVDFGAQVSCHIIYDIPDPVVNRMKSVVKSRADRRGASRRQKEGGGGRGGETGGGLTCPTHGATLQPSRPEDTVPARTLCNQVLQ